MNVSTFTGASLAIVVSALLTGNATAQTVKFADDFSYDYTNTQIGVYTKNLSTESTVEASAASDLIVDLTHLAPQNGDSAKYEIHAALTPDFFSATGQFGSRPESGVQVFRLKGSFFNRSIDGGPEPGERTDNVETNIFLSLGSNAQNSSSIYCFGYRDSNGLSQPLLPASDSCFDANVTIEPGTNYTLSAGIDRTTKELIIKINDFEARENSPYPFFTPSKTTDGYFAGFELRDGASSGRFVFTNLTADGESLNLTTLTKNYYRTDDFDDFTNDPNRTKAVIDKRLKLTATNIDPEGDADSFLRLNETSPYIEADMIYSSDAEVTQSEDGFSSVRLAGILYNENTNNRDDGNTGNVWASVSLIEYAETGLIGEYCVVRADADDWSVTTDLGDGMEDDACPRFDLPVTYDTSYNASISLDEAARTITFKLDDQQKVYNIISDIYIREQTLLRAQARMGRGTTGTVVGYWDNLRNHPNAKTAEELSDQGIADSDTNVSTNSIDGTSDSGGGTLSYLFLTLIPLLGLRRNRH